MATFEELFPDQEQAPFEPISVGKIDSRLAGIRARGVRQAIPGAAPEGNAFFDAFGDLMEGGPKQPVIQETEYGDFGKSIVAGAGDIGTSLAGAAEYGANKLSGDSQFGRGMESLAGSFRAGRQASSEFSQDWFSSMTPEAQDRSVREFLTLDPNRTIWQGDPKEFLSAIGLKLAGAAPSTAATILPGALMMRAGMGGGAIVYLGASEGGLSLGSIAANIAQEIEQAPESELMESQRYQQLRGQFDEAGARQQLINESQGIAPVVGGLVVGAISAAAGRYLEPVLTGGGSGALGRFGRGFTSEAGQEAGQSGAEQIAQNWAARVFDEDRSLMEGVPEQMAQGAAIGGLAGGMTTMAVGQRPQALPTQSYGTPTNPVGPAPTRTPRPASFEEVFKDQTPPNGGWRGGDAEFGALPDVDSTGQRLMAIGDVDPAVQAALNARRENKIDDMFEQGMTPQEEQAAYIQKPFPVTQTSMDLPQAPTGMIPSGGPTQQPLLQERVRGVGRVPLQPMAAQPIVDDPNLPPEASMERLPGNTMPNGRRPTRADFMRSRAEQLRAERYQGTVRDPNQQDMFAGGEQLMPDEPSAEPMADLSAQLADLADPDSSRFGVYLSPANMQQVGELPSVGVPLANFDGKGGVLIAKDNKVARDLLAMRDQGAANMQEILGFATGAGGGKPANADIAVQQRDEQGNVVRETLVATPEEADATATEFDAPGREGVILSAGMAIKRRAQRIREEQRQAGASSDVKQTRRTAENVIETELGDTPLAMKAMKKIGRAPLSENEAARKLVGYSTRLRKRELKKRIGDVDRPEVLEFDSPETAKSYNELFGQYRDAEISERLATTAEDNARAKTKRESVRRQIDAFRRLNKATTASEKVARTARKISKEEVTKIEREALANAKSRASTEGDLLEGTARTAFETTEDFDSLSDADLNVMFTQAANIASGSRARRGTTDPKTKLQESYASTVFTPHGKTLQEILTAYPTRSEKLKFVARVKRSIERRKYGGKAKTRPITARAVKQGGVPVRRGTFAPAKALDTAPPREMSAEETKQHQHRTATAYAELGKSTKALLQATMKTLRPLINTASKERDAEGNLTDSARQAVYGQAYIRTLYRYGRMLAQLHSRSKSGLKEVERFNKTVNSLLDASPDKVLAKLSQLMQAESAMQANTTAKIDPEQLGPIRDRQKRLLTAIATNEEVSRRIAWSERLHKKWKTNLYFNKFVAPVMQKIIGFTTVDTSLDTKYNVQRRMKGMRPTREEIDGLQFAMKRFRAGANTRKDLFEPLKKFFQQAGYKFDGHELATPMKRDLAPSLPAPRRKPDANRSEAQRRAGMTEEQRNAEDRRNKLSSPGTKELDLELLDVSADTASNRVAARAVVDALEGSTNGAMSLDSALKLMSVKLPTDHPYQDIIQRLVSLNMSDAIVEWDRTGKLLGDSFGRFNTRTDPTGDQYRTLRFNRKKYEDARAAGFDPSTGFLHAIVHESVHAATHGAVQNNPRVKAAVWAIMRQARIAAKEQNISLLAGDKEYYGFRDNSVDEFIAEAFSSQDFQDKLREIQLEPQRTVWQVIVSLVKRLLGMSEIARADNVLDVVLATTDKLFTGEIARPTAGASSLQIDDSSLRGKISNVIDKTMQSSRVTKDIRQRAVNTIEKNKEGGSKFLLSALTMEQIRDFYAKDFGGSGGPLSEYMKAFFQRNADNSAGMEVADKLSRRWTELTERLGAEHALELSRLMSEGTLYGIHANEQLQSKSNAHVKSNSQKTRHAELHRRFKALPNEFKHLYTDLQDYYAETLNREVSLMTLNALRAYLTKGEDAPMSEKSFANYTETDIAKLKLNTNEGLEKEFGDKLQDSTRKLIVRIASLSQMREGPYFPLMRFGDYVVTAEKVRERKTFSDAKTARAWATEQREEDPTLSVSSPMESGSQYVVEVTEKEVRMAESPSEAEQNRKDLIDFYGDGNVSQVQLKAQLYSRESTISSNSALGTILGKLDGNPAAQAAIKDFYLRSLSDGAFRKREIKRANRRGIDYDLQHRTFANYAKSAAYYTSQLRFGWQLSDALIDAQKYVEETARGKHTSGASAVRMGEVVREINTRDKLTTNHIEVSKLVRGGNALTQFMMLTSPSYWMINATQPYMVTLPWLAARTSTGEATAALLNAQKMIASPIVNQMSESGIGIKALWSKTAAEKAFTVLEQVEEYIQKRGGDRAGEYIAMLNKLKRESIIDLSFVAELRDIAEGQNTTLSQRVLDASRIMSHLTEVNNRIMTAIAAYDLYRNKGLTVEQAEGFAKQAVSLTQFNYSAGNAPRLFQARGPLGQLGPLVFQFMKYPQHMYALLIDNMRRAVSSGGVDREIAVKTLAGVFATHLAAGGLIGAMLQPIKWAIGLTLAAFGSEDEPYDLKSALSGETFDRLIREATAELFGTDAGEIISAGLPRAAGIDVSNRMSLGTLYFLDLKTDSAESTVGSLFAGFGGPLLNLGMGWMRGAQYMHEGQVQKGMESFLPKFAKDAMRAVRYSSEGLTDATGKEIIGAKDMSPWQLFTQSVGFQPAQVSEKYAQRAAIKSAQANDDTRRSLLLRRFSTAESDEKGGIMREIAAFNKANPEAGISRSQLLKSARSFKQREQRVRRYGADLNKKDIAYADEGSYYNVEN